MLYSDGLELYMLSSPFENGSLGLIRLRDSYK